MSLQSPCALLMLHDAADDVWHLLTESFFTLKAEIFFSTLILLFCWSLLSRPFSCFKLGGFVWCKPWEIQRDEHVLKQVQLRKELNMVLLGPLPDKSRTLPWPPAYQAHVHKMSSCSSIWILKHLPSHPFHACLTYLPLPYVCLYKTGKVAAGE